MNKETTYLLVVIIIALAVLGLGAEYFAFKYFTLNISKGSGTFESEKSGPSPSPTPALSSEKAITSFNFQKPLATGLIDEVSHTVVITVPSGTDVSNLKPTVSFSENASLLPASDTDQNFTYPVVYTITAQDGSTQKYAITVKTGQYPLESDILSKVKTTKNSIVSFRFLSTYPAVDGVINDDDGTIVVTVPSGTNLIALMPTIVASNGATVSPASAVLQNFSEPVGYTVTAKDGSTKIYSVTVVSEDNSG